MDRSPGGGEGARRPPLLRGTTALDPMMVTEGATVTTRRHGDRGATLVEYSVLVLLVAAVVVVAAATLGLRVVELFESVDLPG